MTTIFHASNGLHFNSFGELVSTPDGRAYSLAELRTARLEWARDALKEKTMSKPPTVKEFAKFLRSQDVHMSGRTGELDMVEEVPLIALHHIFMKLLEKQNAPTPKLPTEPGLYFDTNEDSWYLTSWGKWWNCTVFEDEYIWREVNSATDPANYLPFTAFEEHGAVKGK